MRKEVSYVIVVVLIAAVLFWLYSLGPKFTGYVVYENETSCEGAGYAWENITEENCTDIPDCILCEEGCVTNYTEVLCEEGCQENCTDIPDCILCEEGCVTNYTEVLCEEGCYEICQECEEVIIGGHCVVCGADFLDLCLDETSCTDAGGYWYNNICNEEAEPFSVTINEPSGTKDIDSGIPIEFDITGAENLSLSCWYNLKFSEDDTIAITNTTLTDCESSSFDVPDEGEYVLNLYVNNSLGLFSDESFFTISLPTETEETSEEEEEESSSGESSTQVPVVPSFRLSAAELSAVSINSGNTQEITWSISSTGRNNVSACSIKPLGDYAAWIVASEDTLNINSEEEGVFSFSVLVPEETVEGSYLLSVSVECAETAVSKDFSVEVLPATTEETSTGAPVGGFAIFAGIGAGEAIIFIVVLFVLVFIFVFARRMRKSGKTLRDVLGNYNFNKFRLRFKRQ